jgi:osmotically-inducible protein OsmY
MLLRPFHRLARRLTRTFARDDRMTTRDRNLARRLFATFERELELAEVQGIHFYVQNGIVTLYGAVRHELDRDLLNSLIRQIPGVKGVISSLQIVDARFQDVSESDG